jgi:hypothetical protein
MKLWLLISFAVIIAPVVAYAELNIHADASSILIWNEGVTSCEISVWRNMSENIILLRPFGKKIINLSDEQITVLYEGRILFSGMQKARRSESVSSIVLEQKVESQSYLSSSIKACLFGVSAALIAVIMLTGVFLYNKSDHKL